MVIRINKLEKLFSFGVNRACFLFLKNDRPSTSTSNSIYLIGKLWASNDNLKDAYHNGSHIINEQYIYRHRRQKVILRYGIHLIILQMKAVLDCRAKIRSHKRRGCLTLWGHRRSHSWVNLCHSEVAGDTLVGLRLWCLIWHIIILKAEPRGLSRLSKKGND